MTSTTDPYMNLANAIIVQAANDYRKALLQLKENPDYYPAKKEKTEIEDFFLGPWFGVLSVADPEYILSALRRECA